MACAVAMTGALLSGCPDDEEPTTPTADATADMTADMTADGAGPDATPDGAGPDATPDATPDGAGPDATPDATPDGTADGEVVASNTIADVVTNNPNTTLLLAAVVQANLAGTLAGDGPFTVFAPDDTAIQAVIDTFAAAGATYDQDNDGDFDADDLLALPNLGDILGFHVVSGQAIMAQTIIDAGAGSVTTVEGSDLSYQVRDGKVYIQGGTQVTTPDVMADNGVIHIVDSMVFAPGDFPGNIVERLLIAPGFSSLVGAATTATLGGDPVANALAADGTMTLFAPHNEAFAALSEAPTGGELTDTLLYHVVPADADAATVLGSNIHPTLLNNGAPIAVDADAVTIGGAAISTTELTASNGRIHVIDSVITAPGDIVDVATAAGDFGVLLAALTDQGLAGTFVDDTAGDQSADLFTVFAPTDAAFVALVEALGFDATSATLFADVDAALNPTWNFSAVLQHHVISGVVGSGDVVTALGAGTNPSSILDSANHSSTIELDLLAGDEGDVVALMGYAQVVVTDIVTRNGIIHVIDVPIFPTNTVDDIDFPGTMTNLVQAAPIFSTLLAAVGAQGTDVAGALGTGPKTLFAPSNAAFAKIADLDPILTNAGLLENVLWFHALLSAVDSAGAVAAAGGTVETALGTVGDSATYNPDLTITNNGGALELTPTATGDPATIVRTDINTTTGPVHIIDEVLAPAAN